MTHSHERGTRTRPRREATIPRGLAASIACASALAAAMAVAQPVGDAVAQLIATDQRMQRAFVERDGRALREILADDYVLVTSKGQTATKSDVIDEMESGAVTWEINETSGWQVFVHGDTGVVVAVLHAKGVSHGTPFDRRIRFSDVYVRDGNAWRNVHAHVAAAGAT